MKPKHDVIMDRENHLLLIDGVPYVVGKEEKKKIDGITHYPIIHMKPATKKDIDDSIKKLVNKLKGQVTKEELLTHLLRSESYYKEIKQFERAIDKGAEIKKQEGCISFKIGKKHLQLID